MKNFPLWTSWLVLVLFHSAMANSPNLLAQADEAFKHRADPQQAQFALDTYREQVKETERKDPESLWRLSMGCYFVGLRSTLDPKAQEKIFEEGRDAGLLASKLAPKCASCRFWAAINMALYGQTVGVFKMLFSLKQIKDLLKESMELDPTYAYSGAERLLGLIYQKIPGILGGSNSRAEDYFKQAIRTSPDEPLNYLFLAELYSDNLDDSKAALATIQKSLIVQQSISLADDRLESIEALSQLKQLEAKLSSRLSQSLQPEH
jgi:tetratricopeptide (TPR) repeat protein